MGTELVRIYHSNYLASCDYNHNGPRGRFDHHAPGVPRHDPLHGVYYGAFTLSGCVIEVFGDAGVIEPCAYGVAVVRTLRALRLLDLRGGGGWHAGTVAAITKDADRALTQCWARYFYDTPAVYDVIDGILYENAHNAEEAVVLFERAGALDVVHDSGLSDARWTADLDEIALSFGLIVDR